MNIQHWDDELEIFEGDSALSDADADGAIVHLWQHKNDDVVFSIKEGYILEKEEGSNLYIIKKKTK